LPKPSLADKVTIAKRWIEKGYNKAVVLNFVGLAVSTYYYNTTGKVQNPKKPVGRKPPGYSLNNQGEKISDELIKEYLLELVCGDGFPYGYSKLTSSLKEDYQLMINHKKVYRLCKELNILRPQRKVYPKRPRKLAKKMEVTGPNQHWQMDLKYGYIAGTGRFFFQISVIDVFDRSIPAYHLGLTATAKDAVRVLMNALQKKGLHKGQKMPVIRTDNGPQFIAKVFQETCDIWNLEHERIPVRSPSMNAYIDSFHAILEDECYSRHEFQDFEDVYRIVSGYMDYYNNRRRHGSINNMAPMKFYRSVMANQVQPKRLVA